MNSKDELISCFASHSIHESDDDYYRLKILSKNDAIYYRKSIGLKLLNKKESYPIGIVKDDHLLALAIALPRIEDSAVFNMRIGSIEWLTMDHSLSCNERKDVISHLLQQCHKSWSQVFNMVTVLIDFDQYEILEAIQKHGARVYGGDYTWVCKLNRIKESIFKEDSLENVTLAGKEDTQSLIECAKQSYATYRSHYHADSRLDINLCSDTYISWVKKHVADDGQVVIVKNEEGVIIGFSTINPHSELNEYFRSDLVGEIAVSGVSPFARGMRVYELTLVRGIKWFKEKNYCYIVYGCSANNYVVQSTWIKLGDFRPKRFCYRFHWWLGESGKNVL